MFTRHCLELVGQEFSGRVENAGLGVLRATHWISFEASLLVRE